MTAEYRLDIKTAAGVLRAQVVDFRYITYTKRVNAPGLLAFSLRDDHPALDELSLDGQIEIWRRYVEHGIDWYVDFYALYRPSQEQFMTVDGLDIFTAYCPGQMHFLSRRLIAWDSGIANRSTFSAVPAETALKILVRYNATSDATVANGRDRAGAITGISVATDNAGGNTISWNGSRKNLLNELQDIARVAGGDFDLIKTSAQAWEFRFYVGQRGTNRAATIAFDPLLGNMKEPSYKRNRTNEKTVAIVGGQGVATARDIVIRTGSDYSASNDIEEFVSASNAAAGDTAALNAAGDKALDELRAREQFTFKPLQTPSTLYGRDYFVGDVVSARYKTVSSTQKIVQATVSVNDSGKDEINFEMAAV